MKALKPLPVSCRLRVALARAKELGCTVRPLNRTGETSIVTPQQRRLTINSRQSDAPFVLIHALNRLLPAPERAGLTPIVNGGLSPHSELRPATKPKRSKPPKPPKPKLHRSDLQEILQLVESALPATTGAAETSLARARMLLLAGGTTTTLSPFLSYLYTKKVPSLLP